MKANVKNMDVKATTFKAVQLLTGTTHLLTTAIAKATVNTEASIGNKLCQGSVSELKQSRISMTEERLNKVNDLASDWMCKFKEVKERRELNLKTK